MAVATEYSIVLIDGHKLFRNSSTNLSDFVSIRKTRISVYDRFIGPAKFSFVSCEHGSEMSHSLRPIIIVSILLVLSKYFKDINSIKTKHASA